jgi:hypothetical protein
MKPPIIIGAGLAGLVAAHAWPQATVLERATGPSPQHRALLRFRSDAVARLTGMEFRRVLVRKGLWSDGAYRAPDIRLANLYAQKVLGEAGLGAARSVWDLAPVERFTAPEDFYSQMVEAVGPRIQWGISAKPSVIHDPIVSTAPLPVTLADCGVNFPEGTFVRAPITVERWRVRGADLYQTVYFPDLDTRLYRASITGSVLILECAGQSPDAADIDLVLRAFGLFAPAVDLEERVEQRFGKIAEIDSALRKNLLFKLTHEHDIYSLGRFATWRNVLLDDVVHDIDVIKRLMRSGAKYDLKRAAA